MIKVMNRKEIHEVPKVPSLVLARVDQDYVETFDAFGPYVSSLVIYVIPPSCVASQWKHGHLS